MCLLNKSRTFNKPAFQSVQALVGIINCRLFKKEIARNASTLLISAPYGVCGFDCVPSDDGACPEFKTGTGHECGMHLWFVDLYIGKFDRCWHSKSDSVLW